MNSTTQDELRKKVLELTVLAGQKYIKTHVFEDYTLAKEIMKEFDKALQLAVVSARADEISLICDETELFTKKRNKAVYNLYLPMAYLIQRVSELKKQKAELEGGDSE